MTSKESSTQTWWLEPRDPLVFGDGSRIPALAPRHRFLLPPQGTLAGMVRTRYVAGQADVSRDTARSLLHIEVRGPWLARLRGDGTVPELWLPIPADVMAVRNEQEKTETYLPSRVVELDPEEGTLWPDDWPGDSRSLPMLIEKAERLDGIKTSRPDFPFWPLQDVVRWNLDPQGLARRPGKRPIRPEYRVHVGIDDATWTAEAEALFSSAGLRYGKDFGLAAEVLDRRPVQDSSGPTPGAPPHLLILGAESRAVSCTALPGGCFPAFDAFQRLYEERIEQILAAGDRLGLRLQLLTPASFGGWRPEKWPEKLQGRLLAACLDRYVPVSGWDLQAGGPRSVRRLVPAGTVYLFGEYPDSTTVLDLCSKWWSRSLCTGQPGDDNSLLAPPCHDGYGLVLPTPFGLPRSPKS